ncbi:MAG: flagellar export protein FliJ [Oscillospiraceae bacterium]|jgi:hypothetical protein
MKRFAFSLERMLSFKRTMYEKERNTLAQLRAERLSVEQRRDNTERQMLEKHAAFRQKAATEGVRIDEVTSMSFHRESADHLITLLEMEMARLDVEIEKQLEIVMALDKEVKSLEKLREKQWEEYTAESIREENERILEIVSGRFVQTQSEAEPY